MLYQATKARVVWAQAELPEIAHPARVASGERLAAEYAAEVVAAHAAAEAAKVAIEVATRKLDAMLLETGRRIKTATEKDEVHLAEALAATLEPVKAQHEQQVRAWERQIELYHEKVAESGAPHVTSHGLVPAPAPASDEDEDDECILCFMAYEDCVVTPCKHIFCRDCISPWVEVHETCPMCRHMIRLTELESRR